MLVKDAAAVVNQIQPKNHDHGRSCNQLVLLDYQCNSDNLNVYLLHWLFPELTENYRPKEEDNLFTGTSQSSKKVYRTFNSLRMSSDTNLHRSSQSDLEMGTAADAEKGGDSKIKEPKPKTTGQRAKSILRNNIIVILLIVALILGIVLGICLRLRDEPYSKRELMYLRFPGELLMNMLKLLILPLIVSSLVSGMTSLDGRSSGKLGLRAVVYYITTTLAAVILGIILVVSIEPGKRGDRPEGSTEFREVDPADTFLDLIRQMFPDNIVEATFQKSLTTLKEVKEEETTPSPAPENGTTLATTILMFTANTTIAENATSPKRELEPVLEVVRGINMLGLVVFSIALGIAINHIGEKGLPLKGLFDSLAEATLVLIRVVIWYSPLGVLFLVMEEVVSMANPQQTFEQLSFYFITVMAGLAIHGFVTLPAVYFVICRKNPYRFMYGVLQALVTALGTSSSSATLPVTMRNLEENNGIDPRITGFVAPVGATINMDGTALYEAVAVIFIGQVEGFNLDIGNIIVICLTSTAAAIGAAGVPQAGLVTMVIVLAAVGFPADRVGLILAIDWLLDRFRTAINVLGDAYGAGIVHKLSKADLDRMDEEDRQKEIDDAKLQEKSFADVTENVLPSSPNGKVPHPPPDSDDLKKNGYANESFVISERF